MTTHPEDAYLDHNERFDAITTRSELGFRFGSVGVADMLSIRPDRCFCRPEHGWECNWASQLGRPQGEPIGDAMVWAYGDPIQPRNPWPDTDAAVRHA